MRGFQRWCAVLANVCLLVAVLVSPAAANGYPEFVGVYLKTGGECHKLPEAEVIDRLKFSELMPFRLPASGRMSTLPTLLAKGHRFDAYAAEDIAAAPPLNGPFEGIFVRSRHPSEEVFLEYITPLDAFGTLQNPAPGGLGVEVNGRRGTMPLECSAFGADILWLQQQQLRCRID